MKSCIVFMLLLLTPAALAEAPDKTPASDAYLEELQRLHEVDSLLELQLRIANKLVECRDTGFPCGDTEHRAARETDESQHQASARLPIAAPQVLAVYRDRARFRLDDTRTVEVRTGETFGTWRLIAVNVDTVVLADEHGRAWHVPVQIP